MFLKLLSTMLFLFYLQNCFSQIISANKTQKVKNKKTIKTKTQYSDSLNGNMILLSFSQGNSFRNLSITENIVKKQDQLNAETKISVSNFNIQFKNKLTENLYMNFGFGNQNYGQKFDFIGDTSVSYKTTYSNISLPIQITIQTGKKLNFFLSTGFQAQMIYKYRKEEKTVIAGIENSVNYKSEKLLSPFTLASCSNLGIQYNTKILSFAISGEYVHQLNSTYQAQKGIKLMPYFMGLRFSIGFNI